MSRKQLFSIGALMALCVAIGVLLATDWNRTPAGFAGPNDVKLGADAPPVALSSEVKTLNDAFVAVSKAVTSQVVSIDVTSKASSSDRFSEDDFNDPFEMFRQFSPPTPQRGSGSGVIISSDGYILTNNHVVEAGTGSIVVELTDGRRFDAELIGRDSLTDLAVIKINARDLPAAAFGNSNEVQVGQIVIAVGNPLGLNSTVTQGIVSALGRGQLNLNSDRYGVEDFIQTDAAINPGNSGGGLFDLKGTLVGINSAIATRTGYYQGYGFAIPIDLARSVAEDLIDDGHINRGYIGVTISPVSSTMAKALHLDRPEGVLIGDVLKNGAGERAGLKSGDVILEIDDIPVNTPNHLQSQIAQKRAGQDVKLKVYRDGSTFERTVRLKPREEIETMSESVSNRNGRELERDTERNMRLSNLGLEVRPLDSQTKRRLAVDEGVLVGKVDLYGEAMTQGLRQGDVILSVNRKAVKSPSEFRKMVEDMSPGSVMLLQVKSANGSTGLIALELKR